MQDMPKIVDVLQGLQEQCLRITLNEDLNAYIVEQPKDTLPFSVQADIYDALIPVTSSAFSADMTGYWAQRSREGYLERLTEFTLISNKSGSIVGWSGFHLIKDWRHTIIYLDSTGILPQLQSRGTLGTFSRGRLLESAISKIQAGHAVYVTARTESPIVYHGIRQMFSDSKTLYPQVGDAPPDEIVNIGTQLAGWLGQTSIYDSDSMIVRNAYDSLDELYGELPKIGDHELDTLFRESLGPLDAYLLVGRYR